LLDKFIIRFLVSFITIVIPIIIEPILSVIGVDVWKLLDYLLLEIVQMLFAEIIAHFIIVNLIAPAAIILKDAIQIIVLRVLYSVILRHGFKITVAVELDVLITPALYVAEEYGRGISDYYKGKRLDTAREMMTQIESGLKELDDEFRFGYKQSEGLVCMERCPNNTFLIYWLTKHDAPYER
jgi:hypothetical protein